MSVKARALYSFQSVNEEEISFREDEELLVLDENPVDGWLKGENNQGERGLVPASYVEVIRPRSNSNLTDSSLSPASSPGTDSSHFPSALNTLFNTQPSYDSAPHTPFHSQPSYDSAPHTPFNTQPSYDSAPHMPFNMQPSYDSALNTPFNTQSSHDSAPHTPFNMQSSYDSAPHTPFNMQPSNDSALHTPFNTQSSYDSAPHSYDDDDDDDWDDWDDSSTVVGDEDPRRGGRANGHALQSPYTGSNARHRPKLHLERHDSVSSSRKGSMVGRNLNRFSSFVRSGVEAFVLGDVPMMAKIAESYTIEMGPWGPQWKQSPQPFSCSIEDPTKQTKFKGIKTYISYRVTPSHTDQPVYRRYKHFHWLYNRLLHKFTVISVPHLPEKQATGRFEEDFIEKRKRRLILWMDHMTSHPVLSQYEGFELFLMCADDKQWKLGKRRAEKEELVGAHFMLTFQIPSEHQDLQDVEERVDSFKAFARKMDDSVLQLTHVASELARKHLGGFRREFQRLGNAFQSISQAFTLDPPYCSDTLNAAISHTGRTYENIGEMFAEQPKDDLFPMLDTLSLYQGLLDNFPDIIHLQKGAFAKVKESQRMCDEGKMEQEEADGVRRRCRTVGFALHAEMNHFHRRREVNFREMMQAYLQQQICFYQRLVQQLERTLHMYDNL